MGKRIRDPFHTWADRIHPGARAGNNILLFISVVIMLIGAYIWLTDNNLTVMIIGVPIWLIILVRNAIVMSGLRSEYYKAHESKFDNIKPSGTDWSIGQLPPKGPPPPRGPNKTGKRSPFSDN